MKKIKATSPGQRLIGCKWVQKWKRNGVINGGSGALDCTQTPGVDYQDNLSGIFHDVTLRIGSMNWTVRNLDVDQMDVETAFLEGALKESERVLMEYPPGMHLEDVVSRGSAVGNVLRRSAVTDRLLDQAPTRTVPAVEVEVEVRTVTLEPTLENVVVISVGLPSRSKLENWRSTVVPLLIETATKRRRSS